MVGLDALPTYKRGWPGFWALWKIRDAIFSGFVDNQGLDTKHWRVFESKEEPKGSALCSVQTQRPTRRWKGWDGDQLAAIFNFLSAKPKGENRKRQKRRMEEEEETERELVINISFIQANLQHSIAASRVLTRSVSVKGTDMAPIHEPWYR
jgi:hypothetical protein